MRRTLRLTIAAVVLLGSSLGGQAPRRLTVDAIYHPERRVDFSGSGALSVEWIDESRYITTQRGRGALEWVAVTADTGATAPLFDTEQMAKALASLPNVTAADAGRAGVLAFNAARTGALVALSDDLFFYDISARRAARLTSAAGAEEEATFSPDGRSVAFVRANNLYVVDVASGRERAVTNDGGPQILNGKLDWLYQEEIYGRGFFRGYWWSPDSSALAFLQLDERPVPEYTVVDHIPYRPTLEVSDYPKAGDPNPIARLGIARAGGGNPVWADLRSYAGTDLLIVNVTWTPDSQQVVFQVQDREQTWLDINAAERGNGRSRRVLRETTKAWVNASAPPDDDTNAGGNPMWLRDGSFLWLSERNGYRHIYHFGMDGALRRQVTSGRWEVRTVYGVDEQNGVVYFSAPERSPLDTDVYRIGLDGTGLTRLSQRPGTHRATFNPAFTRYVDVWSDVTTPAQTRLHRADGSEIRVLAANPVASHADYRFSKPEFVQVEMRDGVMTDAMLIKPPDFDPSRRYPVYQFTYSGPGASQVRNRWGGSQYIFHQLLAQEGIVVWIHDNRSASGLGVESQWPIYGRLGEMELRDLEDGVAWLEQQPWVDASRVLISGWSYGGFMAAYALTHSTSWSAGIVGAPVTDWRDYDSLYTERFMKTPQNNPEGYRRTAPRFAADRLQGRMLLIHGTIDDNVHMQNSLQFAYELQRAGKMFETMFYPRQRHGFADARLNTHSRQLMYDFVMRTIGSRAAGSAATN